MPVHERQARVAVVDGQPLFREAVVRTVSRSTALRVAGAYGSGRSALRAMINVSPDVAVVDVDAPDLDGLSLLTALIRAGAPTRVVLLATEVEPGGAYAGIAAGARGYVSRRIHAEELRHTITAVAAGETVLAPEAQTAVSAEIAVRGHDEQSVLTPRQLRILDLAAAGWSTRAIAGSLGVTVGAVKRELARTYERLGVLDRASAVAAALRRGLMR